MVPGIHFSFSLRLGEIGFNPGKSGPQVDVPGEGLPDRPAAHGDGGGTDTAEV
jgi:hypothetical protein